LVELGYNLFEKDVTDPNERFTQEEISRMVSEFNTEEKWLVNKALQAGKSPAKAVMWHARARGWRAPDGQQGQQQPAAAPRSAAAQLRRLRVVHLGRQCRSMPLPGTGREGWRGCLSIPVGWWRQSPAEPSVDKLLEMDDEEFGPYIDNLPPQRPQQIMEGVSGTLREFFEVLAS
jgi:hypothetical protein